MKISLKKPLKPWKNIEDARRQIGIYLDKGSTDFPCLKCWGRGGNRDPKDCCPIEGYKMAPLYKCEKCSGTGIGTKKDFIKYYLQEIEVWRIELANYKKKQARLKELKAILSKEDLRILGEALC